MMKMYESCMPSETSKKDRKCTLSPATTISKDNLYGAQQRLMQAFQVTHYLKISTANREVDKTFTVVFAVKVLIEYILHTHTIGIMIPLVTGIQR